MSEEFNENYYNDHHQKSSDTNQLIDFEEPTNPPRASAPTHDDNGYIVVPPTPQSSVDGNGHSGNEFNAKEQNDSINRILETLSNETDSKLQTIANKVVAEADSSTGPQSSASAPPAAPSTSSTKSSTSTSEHNDKQCKTKGCTICPYYLLACDTLSKVDVPPRVRDLLLWSCPKLTGAVFGSVLVLLISLASFSLFTVVGSLLLLASAGIGAYRFYLMLLFRIKGTYDDTFDKLSAKDISLPQDKVKRLINLLETDVNRVANKLKALLLWDNICNSAIAFTGFYFLYCVGSWFNTLTLLILVHVSAFTLPKVYQVYKQPIDQGIEKATTAVHKVVKQISAKLPFLHGKKKTQ